MPARLRVCSAPACPNLHEGAGKCPSCKAEAEAKRRPDGNPYSTKGHRSFRTQVLAHHPYCQCPGDCGRTHNGICAQPSTVADHWPHERRDLVDAGLDPNDPVRGRGLCAQCHDRKTARTAQGGWNKRD